MAKKKKKLDRIDRVCLELKEYNKKHNTKYSYGDYTALVRTGKIKPNRGDWYE
jgi:hypothetical protein